VRTCLLRHHYREEWEYRESELAAAQAWVDDLGRAAAAESQSTDGAAAVDDVLDALDRDLDTASALKTLERSIRLRLPGWRRAACLLGLRLTG
jgi:L-cysteine:1D-myo-inositol 2-amino-2-deoxy-alpha-D-glucopyranoside ligase